ncbi:MAG: hypothetical protein IOC90_08440 [Methylocystis sp.]|nr:hypothetical protein [Methylocystis sp.]MCA3583259.1 hypothetical protein [Methylocystis sp.]MCA3588044.1 hypothetical protein [Methylocystis sp.]MCA3591514.1 hypothetical protein [Methylocystis sp.]
MRRFKPIIASLSLGFAAAAIALPSGEAMAQAASCQTDFQKVMGPRQALIDRINGFRTKRPTAELACSTLTQLVAADRKVIDWMTENKDWCQIPDAIVEQLQEASGQAAASRKSTCTAAKNQQMQMDRARSQQPSGPPPVGSGVRLPQGAL